jgi:hypothetical protein
MLFFLPHPFQLVFLDAASFDANPSCASAGEVTSTAIKIAAHGNKSQQEREGQSPLPLSVRRPRYIVGGPPITGSDTDPEFASAAANE